MASTLQMFMLLVGTSVFSDTARGAVSGKGESLRRIHCEILMLVALLLGVPVRGAEVTPEDLELLNDRDSFTQIVEALEQAESHEQSQPQVASSERVGEVANVDFDPPTFASVGSLMSVMGELRQFGGKPDSNKGKEISGLMAPKVTFGDSKKPSLSSLSKKKPTPVVPVESGEEKSDEAVDESKTPEEQMRELAERDSDTIADYLDFRDFIRENPELVEERSDEVEGFFEKAKKLFQQFEERDVLVNDGQTPLKEAFQKYVEGTRPEEPVDSAQPRGTPEGGSKNPAAQTHLAK